MEDNLAMIFMGIVAVFLLCHFPRIFLGVHEMVIANEVLACGKLQQALRKTLIEVRQLHSTLGFAMGLTANLGIATTIRLTNLCHYIIATLGITTSNFGLYVVK